jgi:hypothetical protein
MGRGKGRGHGIWYRERMMGRSRVVVEVGQEEE